MNVSDLIDYLNQIDNPGETSVVIDDDDFTTCKCHTPVRRRKKPNPGDGDDAPSECDGLTVAGCTGAERSRCFLVLRKASTVHTHDGRNNMTNVPDYTRGDDGEPVPLTQAEIETFVGELHETIDLLMEQGVPEDQHGQVRKGLVDQLRNDQSVYDEQHDYVSLRFVLAEWPDTVADAGYIAHFTPEAWVNDQAIATDPEGDQEWDASVNDLPFDYRRALIAEIDANDEALDTYDMLKHDPAAPQWVRDHQGPFTIRVRRA